MSTIKEFARDPRGYVFMSDSRDIAVAHTNRQEVYDWCGANKVTVEYKGTMVGIDVWRIRDEQQRVLFSLKWS